ncbi:MAG: LLM class F420-dependent oxidoreductase [Anaerolineaceae bacterium]|nr:LLM class F420-dependent oxidoreductase [Anaerolineaceae bacterium]
MIEIALMVSGQNGLTWPRWKKIVRAAEDLGFAGLYMSDHFTNPEPPDLDSLELWVALTWLAGNTERIEFGPMVSPVSFRHPAMTARMGCSVDDLSGGRLQLALGAGWQVREHHNYSYDLLAVPARFDRFEEALKIITHLVRSDEPLDFEGKYYQMNEAVLLPRPQRAGGPPIMIGGNGPKRTLPLAARFADEWNAVFIPPAKFKELNSMLDKMILANNRKPANVRRSLMTGTAISKDEDKITERLRGKTRAEMRQDGAIVGKPAEIGEQISEYEEAGVQRLMLRWFDVDDIEGLENLAKNLF